MAQIKPAEVSLEAGNLTEHSAELDDDGRPRRTGTVLTARAHIVTSVIGSGVPSLPWAVAQLGSYQVFCQPIYAFVESRAAAAWPDSAFVSKELRVGPFAPSALRLVWRSAFVCLATVVAMALPFFGSVVVLIGAVTFWPLTVYFPVEMYIKQRAVARGSTQWIFLKALAAVCLVVSVVATVGSIASFVGAFKVFRPFSG